MASDDPEIGAESQGLSPTTEAAAEQTSRQTRTASRVADDQSSRGATGDSESVETASGAATTGRAATTIDRSNSETPGETSTGLHEREHSTPGVDDEVMMMALDAGEYRIFAVQVVKEGTAKALTSELRPAGQIDSLRALRNRDDVLLVRPLIDQRRVN